MKKPALWSQNYDEINVERGQLKRVRLEPFKMRPYGYLYRCKNLTRTVCRKQSLRVLTEMQSWYILLCVVTHSTFYSPINYLLWFILSCKHGYTKSFTKVYILLSRFWKCGKTTQLRHGDFQFCKVAIWSSSYLSND